MTKVTAEQYKQYQDLENKLSDALDKGDEKLVTQILAEITEWSVGAHADLKQPVEVEGDVPDTGYVKPGGWGANTDAKTWTITNMKDTPTLFKVIDSAGKNVAVNFRTQAGAQAYIDSHKGGGPPPPPPPPGPTPGPSGGNDANGQKMIHPSKAGGQFITTHAARYFTRNYASGKPSEPTTEMDITGINFANQECTAIIQMTGMSHPDTIDWKLRGGQHSSSTPKTGTCYDLEVMTDGSAKMTLEVESPHPNNHAAHQPQLFKPGDLSKARFGWKGVTLDTPDGKGVLIESWINLTPDDQNGWKKYISVVDTGQLYKGTSPILKPYGTIAKVRIDGIIGKPTFDKVSCREITN